MSEAVVGVVDVGRPKVLSKKQTIEFRFHDFANLSHKPKEFILSDSILCHGHLWALKLFPMGRDLTTGMRYDMPTGMRYDPSDDRSVYVSAFLKRCDQPGGDESNVKAKYSFRVDSAHYRVSARKSDKFKPNRSLGWSHFANRSEVLDTAKNFLVDGTLTIKVDLQIYSDKPEKWTPGSRLASDMLQTLNSAAHSDVSFVIGENKFPAHRGVLASRAPLLLELTEDVDQGSEIPIDCTRIFQAFLHFVYSDKIPPTVSLKEDAMELLEVADMYGCSSLKLLAESEIASSGITVENTADLLLFADSKNCALLKEVVMDFFVANKGAVMESPGYSRLRESARVLDELMSRLVKPTISPKDDETDIDSMRITPLRRRLEKRGLDVHGTREMLVKRLKTSSEQESTHNAPDQANTERA